MNLRIIRRRRTRFGREGLKNLMARRYPVKWDVALIFLIALIGCQKLSANQVCFNKQCINVEVVYKPEDVNRGLQFRESLDQNAGMLFVFSESERHSFWMKDTLIPLDMIWLDYARRIVHIVFNVPPCKMDPCPTYTPLKNATYVLELNAGRAADLKLKEGDAAEFFFKEDRKSVV